VAVGHGLQDECVSASIDGLTDMFFESSAGGLCADAFFFGSIGEEEIAQGCAGFASLVGYFDPSSIHPISGSIDDLPDICGLERPTAGVFFSEHCEHVGERGAFVVILFLREE